MCIYIYIGHTAAYGNPMGALGGPLVSPRPTWALKGSSREHIGNLMTLTVVNISGFPKIEHQSNQNKSFLFGQSGFQTPGLVPLDSSRNSMLSRSFYVSELGYGPGSATNRFRHTTFPKQIQSMLRFCLGLSIFSGIDFYEGCETLI